MDDNFFLKKEELERKSIQRLLAMKKKLFKHKFIGDDYMWDCDCSSCKYHIKNYLKVLKQINLINIVCSTKGHYEG